MQYLVLQTSKSYVSCCLCSLVDSSHGGTWHGGMIPLEQQYQLFASSGAIRFPIQPVTEAWKEKVVPNCVIYDYISYIPSFFI